MKKKKGIVIIISIGILLFVVAVLQTIKSGSQEETIKETEKTMESQTTQPAESKEKFILKEGVVIEGEKPQGMKYPCEYSVDMESCNRFLELMDIELNKMEKNEYEHFTNYEIKKNDGETDVHIQISHMVFEYVKDVERSAADSEEKLKKEGEQLLDKILTEGRGFTFYEIYSEGYSGSKSLIYETSIGQVPISSGMHSYNASDDTMIGPSIQMEFESGQPVNFKYIGMEIDEKGESITLQEWDEQSVIDKLQEERGYLMTSGEQEEICSLRYVYMPERNDKGNLELKPEIEIRTNKKGSLGQADDLYYIDMETGNFYNR